MSASFYFKCNKCKEVGGQYTRQQWGWGNFYVITTFKFLAYHTENCGEDCIGIVSENDIDANIFNPENEIKFLDKTKNYFPLFEKQFAESEFDNLDKMRQEWHEEAMQKAKDWYKACYKKDYITEDSEDS